MKKSLSLLAALSTVIISVPLGFAEDTMMTTDTMMPATTSTTMDCSTLVGLKKNACVRAQSEARNPDTMTDRRNSRANDAMSACNDEKGTKKIECLHARAMKGMMMRKAMMKQSATLRGAGKTINTETQAACWGKRGSELGTCLQNLAPKREGSMMMHGSSDSMMKTDGMMMTK